VQVCTKCGERNDRYGPDGRPCYLVPVKDEPPFLSPKDVEPVSQGKGRPP
jgi:hypothetical protein